MIPICTEIENLIHPAQLRENEYLSDNGLICCSKCRTPRQKRLEISGRTMEPRCLCKCQQAEQEKREQEQKHREFLDKVARNRSVGLPDPELRRHTFEKDLGYNPKQITMPSSMFSTGRNSRKTPPDYSCGVTLAPARASSQVVSQMRCWTRGCR